MDRRKIENMMVRIAAVLTTLLELESDTSHGDVWLVDGIPESIVYLAMGMDAADYEQIRSILTQGKLVTVSANVIKLTPDGRIKAREVTEAIRDKVSQ